MKETILNKGKTIWNKNMIIACLIGVCMIWELERLVNIPFLSDIDQWIQTMEMILLGAVMAVIDWRENRWVWIFFGGIVLVFLTSAVRSADILEQTKATLMRGVFVYLLCPMIGIILSGKALDKFVKVMTIIWVLFFSILSIVGIYAAANGLPITDYTGNRPLGVGPEGLLVLLDYHQNVTASHMLIALMMALIMMFFYRHAAWKVFSVITMVPMFFALGLTGSRTSALSFGIGLGIALIFIFRDKFKALITSNAVRRIVACVLVIAVAAVCVLALQTTQRIYNRHVTSQSGLLLSTAKAEENPNEQESKDAAIRERNFIQNDFLSDREHAWKAAFKAMGLDPSIIFIGTSIPLVMATVKEADPTVYHNHLHNMPLQIFVETGIVGLALFLVFIFLFLKSSWNLYADQHKPVWQRLIFLPALCMVITELAECITKLGTWDLASVGMMFSAGLTITLGLKKEKNT